MTPSNTAAREQGSSPPSMHGFGSRQPELITINVGDLNVNLTQPLGGGFPSSGTATTGQNGASLPHESISPVPPADRKHVAAIAPRPRIASSSSSPALSIGTEEPRQEDGSEDSNHHGLAGESERSGVTPPLENASISSDPVPSTVEVPSGLRTTMIRPASTPHSLSTMNSDEQVSVAMRPIAANLQQSSSQKSRQTMNSLRRGKWTVEEESYVARVIQDFNSGYLNAPAGTTLRSYLSDKLHCDPMRITKKFTGDSCIGKRVFHPAVRCPSNTAAIDKAQAELDALERRWHRRLEMQQREAARKAAASAASAAASCRTHFHAHPTSQATSVAAISSIPNSQEAIVTRTASWLDRANAILSTSGHNEPVSQLPGSNHLDGTVLSLPVNEVEAQMQEVQRLIHEGPIIQQTTAGLPRLLDQSLAHEATKQQVMSESTELETSQPPVDKRPRRLSATDSSGAEDAQALVGFLNSVRAAAAAEHQSVM